jgi:enamine deaminase RidA (YjgF/YER057c/UK114 family)
MTSPDNLLAGAEFAEPAATSLAATRQHGSTLYASGQIALRDGKLLATGLVGDQVDVATAQRCAWQCAHNLLTAVRAELGSLDEISAVLRLGVYVASADGFTDQPLVAHGASRLMLDVLGPVAGAHTRTAIGVRALPLGTPVEVDAIFSTRSPR